MLVNDGRGKKETWISSAGAEEDVLFILTNLSYNEFY